jgi:hypothetical protein
MAIETPTAGKDERSQDLRIRHAASAISASQAMPAACQREAGDHQRALADLVGQRAGDRRDGQERRRPGDQPPDRRRAGS